MPKNIVLLSDGTGNSSAQLLKTNVWRVYESLQLTDPSIQVACYDDGIGTSSFKPLAVIGGAFGVGLTRNVLRLYRFLCEHYDPGDQIFMFGFSRGAFTIRVLNALVCQQGIVRTRPTLPVAGASVMAPDAGEGPRGGVAAAAVVAKAATDDFVYGSELARLSRWAYRDFRRAFDQTGGLVTGARWLRDRTLKAWDSLRGRRAYDRVRNNHDVAAIAFIGLWDTVDAYGLPIDELTNGVDRWVWPLSMPELGLSTKVTRACHVLALDDERNTFHPVLWDEVASGQSQSCAHIEKERITQVWFAGMHSNVGGGYPDDSLSAVSLAWMMKQVGTTLKFVPHLLEHHTEKADPLGRLYDSRSGLKAYYRYNPRRIEWLTNGQTHERVFLPERWAKRWPEVRIARPKIHESVFTRMSAAPEAYAPIVFPRTYAVVMEDGRIVDGADNPYEPPGAAERRVAAQEAAWDLVWRRRLMYFAGVGITLILLAMPFLDGADAALADPNTGTAGRIVAAVGAWLPSLAAPWTEYFTARPWPLVSGLAILWVLYRAGARLQARICLAMRAIWLKVIPPASDQFTTLTPHASTLAAIRSSDTYQGLFGVVKRLILPTLFGVATLLWLAGVANRAAFETTNAAGWRCAGSAAPQSLAALQSSMPLSVPRAAPCARTGVRLEAGRRYDVRVAVTDGVGAPSLAQRAMLTPAVPFRRLWTAGWFVPVARIGDMGLDQYPLDTAITNIIANTTGELFLFVNDAIVPFSLPGFTWGWNASYANNRGSLTVTVTREADER